MLWVVFLAIIYGMLGNTVDRDTSHEDSAEYERMDRFAKLFFYALRNSIGDIIIPDTAYWQLFKNKKNYEE